MTTLKSGFVLTGAEYRWHRMPAGWEWVRTQDGGAELIERKETWILEVGISGSPRVLSFSAHTQKEALHLAALIMAGGQEE